MQSKVDYHVDGDNVDLQLKRRRNFIIKIYRHWSSGTNSRHVRFIIKYIIEKDLELKCRQINRKIASKEFSNINDVLRNFCLKNGYEESLVLADY